MEGLDMLDNTSMTVFYPHDLSIRGAVVVSCEEEVIGKLELERGYVDREAFLSKWGQLVTPDMIGSNSYLVKYRWIRKGESLQIENIRVSVQ
nr:hypothetical protein Clen_542 [Cedratvirus lena]